MVRIRRARGVDLDAIGALARFLDAIAGRLPFATPRIEAIEPDGTTVEQRISGRPMSERIPHLSSDRRRTALRNYFDAAVAVSAIAMPEEPYGLLLADERVTAATWPGFFIASLERHVARIRPDFDPANGKLDALVARAHALLAALPAQPPKVLGHGDVFPGNVMMDDDLSVTGLVDFGTWTLVAEPLYDPVAAVMFAEVADGCGPDDIAWLRSLLIAHAGAAAIPAMTAYRAYFAFTLFDAHDSGALYPKLQPWSLAALRQLADATLGDWATTDR